MCTLGVLFVFSGIFVLYLLFLRRLLERQIVKAFRSSRVRRFTTHFITALVLGVCIDAGLWLITHPCDFKPLKRFETAAADAVMNFWVRSEPNTSIEKNLSPIVWVDIDEKTYERLKEPLAIHRDTLWQLISTAIESDARVVIVDFAMDRPVEAEGDKLLGGDKRLADCLEYYSALARKPDSSPLSPTPPCFHTESLKFFPEVILAKGLRTDRIPFEERRSIRMDEVVVGSTVLFWASPAFTVDPDGIVRKWRLFDRTTTMQKNNPNISGENVLPSIPLLTWAILRRPQLNGHPFETQRFLDDLKTCFASNPTSKSPLPRPCEQSGGEWKLTGQALDQTVYLRDSSTEEIEQRVPYLIGDRTGRWPSPSIPVDGDSRPRPLFYHIFASELLPNDDPHGLLQSKLDYLKKSVVVIGSSYEDSRDFHFTPIGKISGALWMSNAIEGLMEYGQLHDLPRWGHLVFTFLLILAVSGLFAWLHSSIFAAISAGLLILGLVIPGSIWLFKLGTWLDFTLPLAGVLGHRFVEEVEEALRRQPPSAH